MSLKIINRKSVVYRLVTSTTLLLLFSLLLVTTVIYYLLSERMRENDRLYLERAAYSYSQVIKERGPQELLISPEEMVILFNSRNEVIYSRMPQYIDHDYEDEEELRQLQKETNELPLKKSFNTILLLSGEEGSDYLEGLKYKLRQIAVKNNWITLLSFIDHDMVEVLVTRVDETTWMKIGRSSEDREDYLSEIRYIAGMVFIPFVFVGMILSFLLARSFLSPVKNLVATINDIKNGKTSSRAIVRGEGDELDLLTSEFNALLDKNQVLIENLQSTVDSVAHDLRTPITRFRSSAEAALVSHSDDVHSLREALAEGMESTERILKLLNAIMDVAEARTHTMKTASDVVNVGEILSNVIDLYSMVAEEKRIHIPAHIDQDLKVSGDEPRLMQAFGNLLDNALKYSPQGSEVVVSASRDGDNVRISIKDSGIGIRHDDLEKIWDKLYRGDQSRSTPGLGLGLSIVKAIIEVHHGRVTVVSEPGKGSEFIITLPKCNDGVRAV